MGERGVISFLLRFGNSSKRVRQTLLLIWSSLKLRKSDRKRMMDGTIADPSLHRTDSRQIRSSTKGKVRPDRQVVPRDCDDASEEASERIEPVYSNLPSKRSERVSSIGSTLRSAGSRAPVCADDVRPRPPQPLTLTHVSPRPQFDLSLEPQLKENEMATEL